MSSMFTLRYTVWIIGFWWMDFDLLPLQSKKQIISKIKSKTDQSNIHLLEWQVSISAYFQVDERSYQKKAESVQPLRRCEFLFLLFVYPKDHWTLKTGYFEDLKTGCCFTYYHGKSPLNHHLGEYLFIFANHLKQIQVSSVPLTLR